MPQIPKMSQLQKCLKFKKCLSVAHQKSPKFKIDQNSKMTKMQEMMERPERRRREGQRSVRFAFGRRSSLFCVPVLFLYLCLLWVYVFYGFYVGSAKLQCGATPPSVMVLFSLWDNSRVKSIGIIQTFVLSSRHSTLQKSLSGSTTTRTPSMGKKRSLTLNCLINSEKLAVITDVFWIQD